MDIVPYDYSQSFQSRVGAKDTSTWACRGVIWGLMDETGALPSNEDIIQTLEEAGCEIPNDSQLANDIRISRAINEHLRLTREEQELAETKPGTVRIIRAFADDGIYTWSDVERLARTVSASARQPEPQTATRGPDTTSETRAGLEESIAVLTRELGRLVARIDHFLAAQASRDERLARAIEKVTELWRLFILVHRRSIPRDESSQMSEEDTELPVETGEVFGYKDIVPSDQFFGVYVGLDQTQKNLVKQKVRQLVNEGYRAVHSFRIMPQRRPPDTPNTGIAWQTQVTNRLRFSSGEDGEVYRLYALYY